MQTVRLSPSLFKGLNQMVTNVLTSYYKLDQDGVSRGVYIGYTSLTGELSSLTLRSTLTLKNLTGRDPTMRTSPFVQPPTSPSLAKSLLLPLFC